VAAMRTPLCRRTVSTCVAVVAAVMLIFDVVLCLVTTSLNILLPVFGANVTLGLLAVAALWHATKHAPKDPSSPKLPRLPPARRVVPVATPAKRAVPPAPHVTHVEVHALPRWLCCVRSFLPPPPAAAAKKATHHAVTEGTTCSPGSCPVSASLDPHQHRLLPGVRTAAVISELIATPAGLCFPVLRISTTGRECTKDDLTQTLAFSNSVLARRAPFFVIFDLRDTAALIVPPLSLIRKAYAWAKEHAVEWDTQVQAIGVLMANDVVRPLLQLATKLMHPPQPITYARDEGAALAFLAEQRAVRSHAKVSY